MSDTGGVSKQHNPTREAYGELERAYAHFNQRLFDNRLPYCLITFQRQHDTHGYFSANQFVSRGDGSPAHEIALNPAYFAVRSIPETLSVLAREMVTLDQQLNSTGRLPRKRYRNKEWADMAEKIGLMPSDTGLPGGKRVGDKVRTYIVAGGPFDLACDELVDDDFTLSWLDRFPPEEDVAESLAVPALPVADMLEPTALMPNLGHSPDEDSLSSPHTAAQDSTNRLSDELDRIVLEGEGGEGTVAEEQSRVAPVPPKQEAPPMKVFERVDTSALKELGVEPKAPTRNLSKSKFTCPACGANAWGKPSLQLACLGKDAATPHESSRMVSAGQE